MPDVVVTDKKVLEIVAAHAHLEGALLPILHSVQAAFGFVPREAIPTIATALNLSRAEVYGVVSFYHDFGEKPLGRRVVKLCRAEACQATGGNELAMHALKHFGIGWNETTGDGAVTIKAVYCIGFCSVAPAALVDGSPMGRLTAEKLIDAVEGNT